MMKHYDIAFVGMGSIGKRHLRNLCQLLTSQGDSYTIDLYRSSLDRLLPSDISEEVANQYLCSEAITKAYDVVFVTNSTAVHKQTIDQFKGHTKAFFIEKPVFDKVIEQPEQYDDVISYVACPLRYNPVLQYVKEEIDVRQVVSVRAMSSSYLPDWRPGQDYRQTYSAHKDLGGGVDIDLIHEWDYLTWLFGMPTQCYGIAGKFSDLEIDSHDTALYVAKNEHVTFELHLDYFGRKTQRTLDIFTVEDTIQCDIVSGVVSYLKEGKTLRFNSERNDFQMAEIKHFFDIVEERVENDSNVAHGVNVLKLTKTYTE